MYIFYYSKHVEIQIRIYPPLIDVGVNLAVSFSCIVGCPICKIYLVDHGYRKFKEKIHFMEQYR